MFLFVTLWWINRNPEIITLLYWKLIFQPPFLPGSVLIYRNITCTYMYHPILANTWHSLSVYPSGPSIKDTPRTERRRSFILYLYPHFRMVRLCLNHIKPPFLMDKLNPYQTLVIHPCWIRSTPRSPRNHCSQFHATLRTQTSSRDWPSDITGLDRESCGKCQVDEASNGSHGSFRVNLQYLIKMVIVNGYVSLPEGNTYQYLPRSTKIYWYMIDTNMAYLSSVCCVGCKHQIDASRWGGPATFPQQTSWSEDPPPIYIFRFVWEWGTSNCEGLSKFCLYFIIKTWACTFPGTPIQSPAIPSVLGKFQDTQRSWPDLVRPQSLENSTIQNLNKFMMIMVVHGPNHFKQLVNNDKDIEIISNN